jgi:hypothetical protein
MKFTLKIASIIIFFGSLVMNIVLWNKLNRIHIQPRIGKDCALELKTIYGEWEPVILVHGYIDNYTVANHLAEISEKEEKEDRGRPPGSYRVKVY